MQTAPRWPPQNDRPWDLTVHMTGPMPHHFTICHFNDNVRGEVASCYYQEATHTQSEKLARLWDGENLWSGIMLLKQLHFSPPYPHADVTRNKMIIPCFSHQTLISFRDWSKYAVGMNHHITSGACFYGTFFTEIKRQSRNTVEHCRKGKRVLKFKTFEFHFANEVRTMPHCTK